MKKWIVTLIVIGLFSGCFLQKVPKEYRQLEDGIYAEIKTLKGNILLNLEHEKVPMTVANFVGLAEGSIKNNFRGKNEPYYDGLIFHRVIKDFMIQGGDPDGGGSGGPGYSFPDEFHKDLRHDKAGILSMANAGPNTNGSQFFITHKATPWLDNKHSVFGHVVKGQDVVDKVEQGEEIAHIKIIRIGKEAMKFKSDKLFEEKLAEFKAKEAEKKESLTADFIEKVKKEYPDVKTTESGLMYVIEREGNGEPAAAGKNVKVHYRGMLPGGSTFDASYDRNKPIEFALGTGRVIKGWDEGIALLKEGGKARLFIPYYLAYGKQNLGPIPSYSNLIFEVELLEVK